jgi:hypothetical protein
MEYLFVKRLLAGDEMCGGVAFTDQMGAFLQELVPKSWSFTPDIEGLSQANMQKKLRIGIILDKAALEEAKR